MPENCGRTWNHPLVAMAQSHHKQQYAAACRAKLLLDVGKLDQALEQAKTAVLLAPDSERSHYLVGLCLARLLQYADAAKEGQECLRLNPKSAPGYYLLALVDFQCGRYRQGLKRIDEALQLDSNNYSFHVLKSALMLHIGKGKQAMAAAEEALSLSPTNPEAIHNRNLALLLLGKDDEAEQGCLEALRSEPNIALAWHQRGLQLLMHGRFDDSQQAYLESLRLNPEDRHAQDGLMRAIASRHALFAPFGRWTIVFRISGASTPERFLISYLLLAPAKFCTCALARNSALAPLALPLGALWLLVIMYIWTVRPLFRLYVRMGWLIKKT